MTHRWIAVPVLIAVVLLGMAAGLSRASASYLPLTGGVLQQFSLLGPAQTFTSLPSPNETLIGAGAAPAPLPIDVPPAPLPTDVPPAPVPSDVPPAPLPSDLAAGPTGGLSEGTPTPTPSIDPMGEPGQSPGPTPTAAAP